MLDVRTLEAPEIGRLVKEMDTKGFATLADFIPSRCLQQARDYVDSQVSQFGLEFFAIHGLDAMRDSFFGELAKASAFNQLLHDVYRAGAGHAPPEDESVFPVIRFLQGRTGRKESHFFHFDATLLTILVPIVIPTKGRYCGDLITFPNVRPVRRSVTVNVLEKALLHNTVSQKLTSWLVRCGWLKPLSIKLEPGNIYLFWGYRSLHANDPCDPDQLRATALYHFGNPHRTRWLARRLLGRNQRHLSDAMSPMQSAAGSAQNELSKAEIQHVSKQPTAGEF